MGNKWEGEELLRFYTFVVYNFGFIYKRKYKLVENYRKAGLSSNDAFTVHNDGISMKIVKMPRSGEKSEKGCLPRSSSQRVTGARAHSKSEVLGEETTKRMTSGNFGSEIRRAQNIGKVSPGGDIASKSSQMSKING